jgi:hypothetical protein
MADVHVSAEAAAKAFALMGLVDDGLIEEFHDEDGDPRYIATPEGLKEIGRILGPSALAEVEAAYEGGFGVGDAVLGLLTARLEGDTDRSWSFVPMDAR